MVLDKQSQNWKEKKLSQEIIKEVKETLKEIYEKGFEIADILKEKNQPIEKKANLGLINVNELFADTDIFYHSLFESFWKLFKEVADNLDNSLVQPWIRVFIEQSCDIFLYSEKSKEKKEEITHKYWLCALGFSKEQVKNLNYDYFIDLLKDPKEKQKFLDLKRMGFPSSEFNKIWHEIFSAITEPNLPNCIEKYFLNMNNKRLTKKQISDFFGDMSLYHHPNILTINSLEKDIRNKSHIFRCFALMAICGRSLIYFFAREIIKMPEKDLDEDFIKKMNTQITELNKIRIKNDTTNTN